MSSKESSVVKTNQPFSALFVSAFIVFIWFLVYILFWTTQYSKVGFKMLLIFFGRLWLLKLTKCMKYYLLCSQFKRTNLENSLDICFHLICFCSYMKIEAFLNPRWYQDQSWDLFGLSTSLTCSSSTSSTNRPPNSQGEDFLFFLATFIQIHLKYSPKIHTGQRFFCCTSNYTLTPRWL